MHLVYVRGARRPVTLAAGGQGPWDVVRHNPRTGEREFPAGPPAGPTVSLRPPDERDWVFVVRRRG